MCMLLAGITGQHGVGVVWFSLTTSNWYFDGSWSNKVFEFSNFTLIVKIRYFLYYYKSSFQATCIISGWIPLSCSFAPHLEKTFNKPGVSWLLKILWIFPKIRTVLTEGPWATRIWATRFWAVRIFGKVQRILSNAILYLESSSYTILRSRGSRKIAILKTNDLTLSYAVLSYTDFH